MTPAQRQAVATLASEFNIAGTQLIDFTKEFGREAPIWLEIGFGDGDNLVSLARARPDVDFVGLEVHEPGVGRALMAASSEELSNVRIVCVDAVEFITTRIAAGALDRVMLLFPDPWPKKRHHKRRIVQPPFVSLIANRLRANGRFHAATDWQPYAEHMLEVLGGEAALAPVERDGTVAAGSTDRQETKFERRGRRLGHDVFDLMFERV